MERTSSRKTCQKAQPSVEENRLLNGYDEVDDDDDDDDDMPEFQGFLPSQTQTSLFKFGYKN